MAAWRTWTTLAMVLATVGTVHAQPYSLKESPQIGDCFQLSLEMSLSGTLHVLKDNQPASLPLSAQAKHAFVERILEINGQGVPRKAARVYETAQASIQAGTSRSERTLRPEHRLLVIQHVKDQGVVYCPQGSLSREELELTSDYLDSLALTGLLPGKEVALQETWKVSPAIVQALCHFEGLSAQDLVCKLEEVKDNVARVSVTGSATGIDLGALVKLNVQAAYRFDLAQHRLIGVEWKQKDERGQGPASPASVVETTYTVHRQRIDQPESLTDVALVSVPAGEPPDGMLPLAFHDAKGRFNLLYGRDWQIVSTTEERTILRLLDRGDFVAQATLTPWKKTDPGKHLTPEEFQKEMAATPGWQQEEVLQSGLAPATEKGRWVYRISATGQMDGLKLVQNFYLIAAPGGEQLVAVFTLTQAQAEKLGARDFELVEGIELPGK
jgi:hypothetical protein